MNQASVTELAESLVARPVNAKLQHGFSKDATYASILTKTSGAQNIERLYQFYAMIEPITPQVTNVSYDDNALTACISFKSPIVLPFGLLKDKLFIPTTTLLHFTHGGDNNKLVIDKQVDLAPYGIDNSIINLPIIGRLWKDYVLPVVSFLILQLAILVLALRSGADLRQEKDLKYNNEIANTVDTALPYLKQGYETASPYIQQGFEKAQFAQSKVQETAQLAQSKVQETAQRAQSKVQETAQIAQARAQPYIESAQPYIKTATDHAQAAQELAMDALSRVPVVNEVLAKQGFSPASKSGNQINGRNKNSNGPSNDRSHSASITIGTIDNPIPIGAEKVLAAQENHSIRTDDSDRTSLCHAVNRSGPQHDSN